MKFKLERLKTHNTQRDYFEVHVVTVPRLIDLICLLCFTVLLHFPSRTQLKYNMFITIVYDISLNI